MDKNVIIERMEDVVEGCMGEEKAACVATCPMHTDAKEYIRLIRDGKGEESIRVIREKLFLPGTLGRVCAHPCEKQCKWNEAESPMAIASLKRYAADNFDDEKNWDLSTKPANGKKVAVIGAGPSGLQAAIDLKKAGCDVTVFEKENVRGGMLRLGIPAYRLPRNVLEREISYLDKLGVKFEMGKAIGKEISLSAMREKFDATVVAVGRHEGRVDRSLEGVDAKGVYSAKDFLKEVSLTENATEAGSHVIVVGGGDVAMDCARSAARLPKTQKVSVVCLEDSFDAMFASEHEILGAKEEGIAFFTGRAIKTIGQNRDRVEGVVLKKCLSMFNAEGRFAPVFDAADTAEVPADTIIFAIGQGVEAGFDELERKPNSSFICDKETMQAEGFEDVFLAGDASGESVIAIQAMATGRRAAESVIRYLEGRDLREGRMLEDTWTFETKLSIPVDWSDKLERRMGMQLLPADERLASFNEVALGFTDEEAKKEADRCRQCACQLCVKECLMLQEVGKCPKTLFEEYLAKGITEVDEMIAYSCNECSQCTLRCPKSYELKEVFTGLKKVYAEENKGLVALDTLVESDATQVLESSEKYCTAVPAAEVVTEPEKKKGTKYVFAPGCSISAYTPEALEKVVRHLKDSLGEENVGVMLQCCGKVTAFLGEEEKYADRNKKAVDILDEMGAEVVITVCPSCYKVFKETAKNQRVIAYWDLMHDLIGIPKEAKGIGTGSDVVFNIHDSCVTRDVVTHHASIRWMLDEMGYKWNEIEKSGTDTRCCGVGGMVCTSNPELYEKVYTRRAKDFNSENIVTYCGSCRGTMQAAGLDAVHILDLLFGQETYMKCMAKDRGYTSEEEMWQNRLETKERFEKFR